MESKVETRPEVVTENPTREAAPVVRLAPEGKRPMEFSPDQRAMIKNMFAKDATDEEFAVLLEIARLKRLNPLTGQCHFVSRNEYVGKDKNGDSIFRKKWSVQVGIDGFRAKAEENQNYDGQSEKQFVFDASGARVISCTVAVHRKDRSHSFVATCHFDEYVQIKKGYGNKPSEPTEMWMKKPRLMLGKCTEAAALRMAFPDELGGLYTPDEMPEEEVEAEPPKPKPPVSGPLSKQKTVEGDVLPPDVKPTDATPVERFETYQESIKVATTADELRVALTGYGTLPKEMHDQIKALAIARNEALEMAANAPPAPKTPGPLDTPAAATGRAPGEEG